MKNIIVAILVGIFGLSTLIAWVTGTLGFLIQYMNTPVPLWATTFLVVLCCLYTYIKVVKILSKLNQMGQASKSPPETVFHANILWLKTDKHPYCPHCFDSEQKLIHLVDGKIVRMISGSSNWVSALKCTHCHYEIEYAIHP